jgi:Holliday junction DNA helicase RuvA
MMIGRIQGRIIERQPPRIVVMVAGLGYEIDVPMSTFYGLPGLQEEVTLYTHLAIREDAHLLYGFASQAERESFRSLLKVSGIGAKSALAILSEMTVEQLALAISAENIAVLCNIPGIGTKTAERLVLELRGKLSANAVSNAKGMPQAKGHHADVLQALLALGYNEKESARVIQTLAAEVSVSEGIRTALKYLSKV